MQLIVSLHVRKKVFQKGVQFRHNSGTMMMIIGALKHNFEEKGVQKYNHLKIVLSSPIEHPFKRVMVPIL